MASSGSVNSRVDNAMNDNDDSSSSQKPPKQYKINALEHTPQITQTSLYSSSACSLDCVP